MIKKSLLYVLLLLVAIPLQAQTADEIIAKYIKAIGGAEKLQSIKSLRRTGTFSGGGGFEAPMVQENKRPAMVREEFTMQGLTGINAYDGKSGWKIQPWSGKKDVEPLGEEEMKSILEDSDFDGPLVGYQQKGNKVEFVGMEPVEGTDALKLKVTLPSGDIYYYYMDTDYFVPIKQETKRIIRGAEHEYETSMGDYKEVEGCYFPFSYESNAKGSQDKSKVTYEKIEANVTLDDSRFVQPQPAAKQPNK